MSNSARIKGRDFEALIRRWLTDQGIPNLNPATIGRPGGDVILRHHPIMLEVKNRKTTALAEWMRQAETDADDLFHAVIVHKRKGVADPAEQWVTMTLDTFTTILGNGSKRPVTRFSGSDRYDDPGR